MALYQETYRLSKGLPSFEKINALLKESTGLNSELEKLDECSFTFSNEMLKTDVEVTVTSGQELLLYFSPRKKKNYYEYSLLNIFEKFIESPKVKIPQHIKKKRKNLTFVER